MARPRILIVEGETVAGADVERALAQLGFGVAGVATDGSDALRLAGLRDPALVLMDLRLRGAMDSLEAARELRERSGVRVVFLADDSDPERLARSLAAEPFGYVRSPFLGAFLACAIEVALHRDVVERALDAQERELGDALSRYDAMLNVADGGIAIEDEAGRLWRINPRLCALFGITAPPAQLIGSEASALRRLIAPRFREPARFLAHAEELSRARRAAIRERWMLEDGREVEYNFVPCFSGERFLGQFWAFRHAAERALDDKPE
jgi:CheY-like chemotaxis protein